MDRKVRVVQFGCGRMGSICMKYALSKGVELVGAYDMNPAIIGKDISERIGGEPVGVAISNAADFKTELKGLNADIVVVTTMSLVKDVYDVLMTCAENGVNAITTCEEAIYPWNSATALTKKLDEVARANGCTLSGSGAQEMQWGSMINNLAGSLNKITKITGETQNNVDDYGIAFANSFGAGMDLDTFNKELAEGYNLSDEEVAKQIEEGTFQPGFMWNSNQWLAERLGFTVTRQEQRLVPHIAEKDTPSSTLGRVVPKGQVIGASSVVKTETAEGVTIESAVKAVVYGPEDFEYDDWTIYGEGEELTVKLPEPPTVEMTCATMVNRIPDVINAKAGFVTTNNMPNCTYLVKSMEQYVK